MFNLKDADFNLGFGNLQTTVPDTIGYWKVSYESALDGEKQTPIEYDLYSCGDVAESFEDHHFSNSEWFGEDEEGETV